MPTTKRTLLSVSLLVALGCGPARFRPPAADEPHADLLIEVAYLRQDPGEELTQQVRVDGGRVQVPDGPDASKRWVRAMRLAPGAHEVSFHAFFEHPELANDIERPVMPGCTPGRATAYVPNDCVVSSQARTVSNWHWNVDAECGKALRLQARTGETLKASFRFYGHGQCEVECVKRGPGSAGLRACSAAR